MNKEFKFRGVRLRVPSSLPTKAEEEEENKSVTDSGKGDLNGWRKLGGIIYKNSFTRIPSLEF